jgi:hypothetical protein
MWKKHIFLILITVFVVAAAGFWLINISSEPRYSEPVTTTTIQPVITTETSGNFNCEDMYDEIENDLDKANYCLSDSDCSIIMLGGWYIDFGCYHFVNKEVDKNAILSKMRTYKEEMKCSQIIDKCAPAPDAKCISNKCVHVRE